MASIIHVENLSKLYRLGQLGAGSLRDEVSGWWSRMRGKDLGMERTSHHAKAKEFWALRDISFEVHPGEVVGIIGRNGAGKSTLLKILSRITQPTGGEALLKGRVASLLEVGTGFHPELSGRENIFLNGAILGMKKAEVASKFDEIVAFAEVEQFIDTPVKRYSSGMYVRLAFAVAAHLEPEILIVDEVLAVGDAAFQQKCLGKMQEISAKSGRTILFVSHSMAAVQRLCTKCILLADGTSCGMGSVETAVLAYTNNGHSAAATTFVTSGVPREKEHLGESARLESIELLTPARFGEPFVVRIGFTVMAPLRGMSVGLGLDTLHGQRMATIDSDASGKTFDFDEGTYTSTLDVRLHLHPGIYMLSGALMSGNHLLDYVPLVGCFEVSTSVHDKVSDRGFAGWRPVVEANVEKIGRTAIDGIATYF